MRRLLFAALLAIGTAHAVVLRVPSEYATIQSALDAIAEHDTVLVDTGVYAEALMAPPLAFTLLGNALTDTGDIARPTIDPSPLPGADSLACMIVPEASHPTIKYMAFRNDWRMYPRRSGVYSTAGIRMYSDELRIDVCRFDSVYGAIRKAYVELESTFYITNCYFWRCPSGISGGGPFCRVVVHDSRFYSDSTGQQISGGPRSLIERCTFQNHKAWTCTSLRGSDCRIANCLFTDYGPPPGDGVRNDAIVTSDFAGQIEDNMFLNCIVTPWLMDLELQCAGEDVFVRRNQFLNCSTLGIFGCAAIGTLCNGAIHAPSNLVVSDNIFSNCRGAPEPAQCAWFVSPAHLSHNRFYSNGPDTTSTVLASDSSVRLFENVFVGNQLAMDQQTIEWDIPVDARQNYWGHPSGPYNEAENPDGLGDEVRGNVQFSPWYPDSSFLDTPIRTTPSVASAALRVYPNPFNSTANLKFEIPEPGIFKIELFDVLGRRIKELWSGPVAYEKTILFDGSALASGIYYVRAWQTTHNRPAATAKLVLMK